jgi:hypothetical protein
VPVFGLRPGRARHVLTVKALKAAQFYSIASSQCCFDLTENGVGDLPDIPREQMRILLGKALNQF